MSIEETLIVIKQTQEETLAVLKELRNSGIVDNKEKIFDFNDLEQMLHVSRRTLFKWKSAGKMVFSQVDKKLYLTDSELRKFLETNKQN